MVVSCAPRFSIPPFPALPDEKRITIQVNTDDLTGTNIDSLFSERLVSAIESDYLFSIENYRSSRNFTQWLVTVRQNPIAVSEKWQPPTIDVQGDLELVHYGPAATDPVDVLAAYAFTGLVGAALTKEDENTYTASLQFRFTVDLDGSSETLLVRVARRADVREISRQRHMQALAGDAVRVFLSDLIDLLSERAIVEVEEASFIAPSEGDAEEKLSQLPNMVIP
jgi:hypothetical protein